MSDQHDDLLRAIAYAPADEVSPSERIKALQMLRETEAAPNHDLDRLDIDDDELDRQLDAFWVVDVVTAVASGAWVNGVDPARFPATAELVERLLRAAAGGGG